MVEVVNSLEDLCRLCAGKIDVLMGLNIFASDHRQIFKKICVCLPIQVSVDDGFPKMVCVECACKLDLMFDFRERSILTAHLFSDMMTVNGGNQIIPADQGIQSITSVAGEHDFNGDFMTCKLEAVKYDNQLTTEMCSAPAPAPAPAPPPPSGSNENILNEENITLHESQGVLSKRKTEQKGRVSRKKVKEVVEREISGEHQQEMDKMENEKTEKLYPQQQQQQQLSQGGDLTGNLPSKDLSTDKLEVDSMMGPNEGSQNLNDCANLEWFFCASCNRTFEDRESYDAHTHDDVKCGGDDDEEEEEEEDNEENGVGGVNNAGPNNDVSSLELEPNKKKKTKEKRTGRGGGGGGGEKKGEGKVCLECGKEYQTNYKLQEHMRKHTGEKPFSCSYEGCKKAFRSKIGLAQHEANHSGQYEFSCSTCGKGFQCKSYLVVHQRVHSDLKPFVCKQCSRKFKTKQSLLDHMNRHLGVKPFLCDICGRGFITKGLCKSHQKVHSGTDNRQYPCHVCRKLFVSKSYLNTHFRIHTGEKPFMCEVCGKGFLTRVDLRIHSTMHTGEKSFVCEMCGKAFARRDALRCHRRSHTGERPYKCEFCGQSFTQFSPMAIHKRLHTGERPYECDVCRKTFVSRSTMLAHRKKHHASNNEDSQFRFVSVDVQQNEMNGHSDEQPSEELVVIEDSPQLLLALSKRHPSVVSQSPSGNFSTQVQKLKNDTSGTGVPTE